jgi:hypothetical protein
MEEEQSSWRKKEARPSSELAGPGPFGCDSLSKSHTVFLYLYIIFLNNFAFSDMI